MQEIARAFWTVSPGTGEIRDELLPDVEPGLLLVEALYSAVSRGTESLVFQGRVPHSEHERMRCPHQVGEFPGPVKYGYANVGRVLRGSEELVDKFVFCLFPHQTKYVVPDDAVVPIPDNVPPERAVLAANLETALNAMWDARPLIGDRVSVVGAGVVGCLCAYLLQRMSLDVELVDVRRERADVANALGATFVTPNEASSERDLVLHATGKADGLRTALSLAARDCQIIELSWFGDEAVSLPLGADFHVKRLCLRSSQVGTVSPNARPRFGYRTRLELALSLCADPALDVLFTSEGAFAELPRVMSGITQPTSAALCHRVRYR